MSQQEKNLFQANNGLIHYKWSRKKGYPVNSKGDKRFSPLYARLGGRTLEAIYQCDIKGWEPGCNDWLKYKGRPPKDKDTDTWGKYLDMYRHWADNNKELMNELRTHCADNDYELCDYFATTPTNQAHALCIILFETQPGYFDRNNQKVYYYDANNFIIRYKVRDTGV